MILQLEVPDQFADALAKAIAEQAGKLAVRDRLVDLREASQITRETRKALKTLADSKKIAHTIIRGQPHFYISDLEEWRKQSRVAATR
jgi:hypothetical protein